MVTVLKCLARFAVHNIYDCKRSKSSVPFVVFNIHLFFETINIFVINNEKNVAKQENLESSSFVFLRTAFGL